MREEHGSTYFEGRLILGDPELEIRTVTMLREALGTDAMIRLDSNTQWSLTTARWVVREIEAFNIRNYAIPSRWRAGTSTSWRTADEPFRHPGNPDRYTRLPLG